MRQFQLGPVVVWTKGHTSNTLFHPIGPVLETGSVYKVRATVQMSQSSGDITVTPAWALSDDGINWGSATPLSGPTLTGDDFQVYTTAWEDISSSINGCLFVRFGVLAKNSSNTKIDTCNISLRIDIRGF